MTAKTGRMMGQELPAFPAPRAPSPAATAAAIAAAAPRGVLGLTDGSVLRPSEESFISASAVVGATAAEEGLMVEVACWCGGDGPTRPCSR